MNSLTRRQFCFSAGLAAAGLRLSQLAFADGSRRGFPNLANIDRQRILKRSEEHTSELQSRLTLVCRLLLEKKKENYTESRSALHAHEPQESPTHIGHA